MNSLNVINCPEMPRHKRFAARSKRRLHSHVGTSEKRVVEVQEAEGCNVSSDDIQQYPIEGHAEIEHESALSTLRSNVKFPSKFWMDATNESQGDSLRACFCKVSDIGLYPMVTHCIYVSSDLTWQVLVHKTRVVQEKCSVLENIPMNLNVESCQQLVETIERSPVCSGNPDPHFVEMMKHKGKTNVDTELHSDLLSVLTSDVIKKCYAKNTFARLFLEQQLKAASCKKSRGMRWHNFIIK